MIFFHTLLSRTLHQVSYFLSKRGENQFLLASKDVENSQKYVLKNILKNINNSENATKHKLSAYSSLKYFQEQVPITDYEYWSETIKQQQEEKINLLANTECQRYQPTSGSTAKIKWIPYTKPFLEELDNAIAPWLADMYRNYPKMKNGKHYWSLSWVPSNLRNKLTASINNDLQLLPWWKRFFMASTMAVPESISLAESSDESFFATACYLLSCSDLSFISVWSPTFALSLLEFIKQHQQEIAQVLASGEWPKEYPGLINIDTPKNIQSSRVLLKWDGIIDEKFTTAIWPRLALISAWDTSSSKIWAEKLQKIFPHSEFQGKGLWATEGVTSIPYGKQFPLALNSHFYEFEDLDTQKIIYSWQLIEGMCVRPIISSANGLLRYAMKDQLKVTGFINSCPCFEFIGRIEGTDMVGEKLSPETAVQLLNAFNLEQDITPITLIAMPANKQHDKPCYLLLCENDNSLVDKDLAKRSAELAEQLESTLSQHFHYQLARELGQLGSARVSIQQDALALYANHKVEQGMVKGNIKVEPLILWQNQDFLIIQNARRSKEKNIKTAGPKAGELV
ncbi:MAG: GH3 auxin-responsive promoter family protein [Oleispira antarctica]|nr:GH3 auxin-responsive promoter family protein [Oleispira antarctica]MBQ0791831.1 GH3 auxin-responsive promoter family protein [Oleispira antarctica]